MRQDPDVVLIGEMRDLETAKRFYDSVFNWGYETDATGYVAVKAGDRVAIFAVATDAPVTPDTLATPDISAAPPTLASPARPAADAGSTQIPSSCASFRCMATIWSSVAAMIR